MRVPQQSSSDGNSLFLTATHLRPARTAVRVEFFRQRHNECVDICHFESFHNDVIGRNFGPSKTIGEVCGNGCRKHDRLLTDVPKEASETPRGHGLDIDSIDRDRARHGVVKPLEERDDGTLPTPTLANQRNLLSSCDGQGHTVEDHHIRSCWIVESCIFYFESFDNDFRFVPFRRTPSLVADHRSVWSLLEHARLDTARSFDGLKQSLEGGSAFSESRETGSKLREAERAHEKSEKYDNHFRSLPWIPSDRIGDPVVNQPSSKPECQCIGAKNKHHHQPKT